MSSSKCLSPVFSTPCPEKQHIKRQQNKDKTPTKQGQINRSCQSQKGYNMKPVDMNELQVERVLYLWHTFKEQTLHRGEYDKFIEWLEYKWS